LIKNKTKKAILGNPSSQEWASCFNKAIQAMFETPMASIGSFTIVHISTIAHTMFFLHLALEQDVELFKTLETRKGKQNHKKSSMSISPSSSIRVVSSSNPLCFFFAFLIVVHSMKAPHLQFTKYAGINTRRTKNLHKLNSWEVKIHVNEFLYSIKVILLLNSSAIGSENNSRYMQNTNKT